MKWPLSYDLKDEEEPATQSPGGRGFQERPKTRGSFSGSRNTQEAGGVWG